MNPVDLLRLVLPHLVSLLTTWIQRPSVPRLESLEDLAPVVDKAPMPSSRRSPSALRVVLAMGVLAAVVPTLVFLQRRQDRRT